MTAAPPRALVHWRDGRKPTTVHLAAIHKMSPFSPFVGADQIFWSYKTIDGVPIGPGMHSTREWAWQALRHWADTYERGATPFPVPEDRAETAEELPVFLPDEESREDREERMRGM